MSKTKIIYLNTSNYNHLLISSNGYLSFVSQKKSKSKSKSKSNQSKNQHIHNCTIWTFISRYTFCELLGRFFKVLFYLWLYINNFYIIFIINFNQMSIDSSSNKSNSQIIQVVMLFNFYSQQIYSVYETLICVILIEVL